MNLRKDSITVDNLRKLDVVIVSVFKKLTNFVLLILGYFLYIISSYAFCFYAFCSLINTKWADGFESLVFGILGYYVARALIEITKESGKKLTNHGKEIQLPNGTLPNFSNSIKKPIR
jgi:hypothetical protein